MLPAHSNVKPTRNLLYADELEFAPNESFYYEHSCENGSYVFATYLIFLDIYYLPVIIISGFIGNFLSCLVLLCTQLKLRSSSYYLAALSMADSGYLFCLFCYSKNVFNLYNKRGFCQIFIYLTYVFSFISVWLIVAFTVERFIAVKYPLKKPYICTANRAKKIVIGLSVVAFILYLFAFWITDVIDNECRLQPKYYDFMEIFNYLDTAGTLIIPVILIVAMNAMIARSLFKLKKYMQKRLDNDDDNNTKEFETYRDSSSQVK
ncbi:neuropeptides capa receptor [Diorhabda carinulata]|uniref:neuropeptides capa receptor n=1 Tax=Diorhabda carinulata TaxID=1163345 RepID=UPI0025A04392|nr:neuropeptides capa receptor [Diorhabda carinulata]